MSVGIASLPLFAPGTDASCVEGAAPVTPPAPALQHNNEFPMHFLALAQARGLGMQALRALVMHFGDLARVWEAAPSELGEVLHAARVPAASQLAGAIRDQRLALLDQGRREWDRLTKKDVRVLGVTDPAFPQRLQGLRNQPLWLFVEGDPFVLTTPPLVAVVGRREASDRGVETAAHLTSEVIGAGMSIVSGLAEGIDARAHRAAARLGTPQVAVLGTGIDVIFPTSTKDLRRRIISDGGAVVTEYLPDEKYGKANFVHRNRIQAGLASVVCPIEGHLKSGTAHTIRFAQDYRRPIIVVTRREPDPANELIYDLIRKGAPAFDLADSGGRREFRTFLATIEGKRLPAPPPPDKQFWVRSAIERLRDLMSYHDLSDEERRAILATISHELGIVRNEAPES